MRKDLSAFVKLRRSLEVSSRIADLSTSSLKCNCSPLGDRIRCLPRLLPSGVQKVRLRLRRLLLVGALPLIQKGLGSYLASNESPREGE